MLERGMNAVGGGGDCRNQSVEKLVSARAAGGDIGSRRDLVAGLGIADVRRRATRRYPALVGKRQAALPRKVGPKNVGQLRAVRVKVNVRRVGVTKGITGTLQASVGGIAAGSADGQDPLAVIALIGIGPPIGTYHVIAPVRR